MLFKERLPAFVPAQPHPLNFLRLERIHRDAAHETNVHAQSPVHARATQTDEDAKLGRRPLGRGRTAIHAAVIGVGLLNVEELGGLWKEKGLGTFDRVSGSTSHIALLAMLAVQTLCW
jgi:hypothetical protein